MRQGFRAHHQVRGFADRELMVLDGDRGGKGERGGKGGEGREEGEGERGEREREMGDDPCIPMPTRKVARQAGAEAVGGIVFGQTQV